MKLSIFLMMTLFLASSCKVAKKSVSKNCTFNGQPISCDTPQRRFEPVEVRQPIVLNVSVAPAISITENTIEILENLQDSDSTIHNGTLYGCNVSSQMLTYEYRVVRDVLFLKLNSEEVRFQLIKREGRGLIGEWFMEERIPGNKWRKDVFKISSDRLEISSTCTYK